MRIFRRRERSDIGYGMQNDDYHRGFRRSGLGQRRGFRQRDYRDGYGSSYSSGYGRSYSSDYGYGSGYGRQPYDRRRMPFWNRQDGYGSHYGSQDDDSGSKTSRILAAITGKAAQVKEKRAEKHTPQAQSSNVVYEASEVKGEYLCSGIVVKE